MGKLKVLMMGGRRCGKTSALASMFNQMIHGATNNFLTVCDNTILETKNISGTNRTEKQDSLADKRLELEYFISKGGYETFLVDAGPTSSYWDYKLQIQIPGTNKKTEIEFRDSAGEFFEAGGRYHNDTVEYIKDCDVFVVVVDTPYLMSGTNVENFAANVVDSIHTFLTQIDNDNGRKVKQVLFVPIKCEKWIQDGLVDKVIAKVQETYGTTIRHLEATGKTEISIIPIQTAGDILFSELRDVYILVNTVTNKIQKCSKITERLVVLANGKNHRITDLEILNEDIEAKFSGTNISRPAAWYHLPNDRKAEYRPHNCEQLPLHIIRFMFNKIESEAMGGFFGNLFGRIFGTITKDDMREALREISSADMIKDNVEGIKTIKKIF